MATLSIIAIIVLLGLMDIFLIVAKGRYERELEKRRDHETMDDRSGE